jgi:hypothetical protein
VGTCAAIQASFSITRQGVTADVTASDSLVLDGTPVATDVFRTQDGSFGVDSRLVFGDLAPNMVNHLEVLTFDFDTARFLTGARVLRLTAGPSGLDTTGDPNPAYYRTFVNGVFGSWTSFNPGAASQDITIPGAFADGVQFSVRLTTAQETSLSFTDFNVAGLFVDLDEVQGDPNPVPEPASLLLFGVAMAAAGRSLRRRRNTAA